jgi:hypothetical protein
MVCKPPAKVAVLLLAGLGSSLRAAAQVRTLVTSVGYQSPVLVVPVVLLSTSSASGAGAWSVGLFGSTLGAEWTTRANPRVTTVMRAEVTPFNANSSRYVYRDGERDSSQEFRDRTVRLNAGLRLQGGSRWRAEVRAIGLSESVAGLDSSTVARWRQPYVGLDLETSYIRVVSDAVLEDRWDGVKVAGSAVGFVGSRPWWRSQLSLGGGKQVGRVMLRGRGWVLLGHNLDVVNQHLVGGCWDLGGSPVLYGYHYAEFRVNRAAVLGLGADLRLAGLWEVGVRVGYLKSPLATTYGEAVRLSGIWNGIGLSVGVGLPRASLVQREKETPLFFAGASAALL